MRKRNLIGLSVLFLLLYAYQTWNIVTFIYFQGLCPVFHKTTTHPPPAPAPAPPLAYRAAGLQQGMQVDCFGPSWERRTRGNNVLMCLSGAPDSFLPPLSPIVASRQIKTNRAFFLFMLKHRAVVFNTAHPLSWAGPGNAGSIFWFIGSTISILPFTTQRRLQGGLQSYEAQ